jgi:hypothetical protein
MPFCLFATLQSFNSIRNAHQPFAFFLVPRQNSNRWFIHSNSITNKKMRQTFVQKA